MNFAATFRATGIVIIALQGACLSLPNGAGEVVGHHSGCELTMQSNSLAGACGEMILKNSGTTSMHGWEIHFDLPTSGHLTNAWNANFRLAGNKVTVDPMPNEIVLAPNQSITLGYCASGAATNITLTAGICSATDPNMTAKLVQVGGTVGLHDTFAALDESRWDVRDGAVPGASWTFDAALLSIAGGLDENVDGTPGALSGSAVQSRDAFQYGRFSARLRAAAGAGVVTSFATAANVATGAQQIMVEVAGSDPNAVTLATVRDGLVTRTRIPVQFDTRTDSHDYAFTWTADGITWTIDGQDVLHTTVVLTAPQHLVLSTWIDDVGAFAGGAAHAHIDAVSYEP